MRELFSSPPVFWRPATPSASLSDRAEDVKNRLCQLKSFVEENGVEEVDERSVMPLLRLVPYRFVSLTLLESTREEERVCLCLLCGTNPPLADVMRQAPVAFGHVVDLLKGIASNCASNNLEAVLPRQVALHSTVFGLLCLNLERGKCFSFVRKEALPFYASVNKGESGRRGRDDGRGDAPTAALSRTEAEAGNRGHLAVVFCETRDIFTFQIHGLQSPGQGQSFDSHTSELPCCEMYQNYGHHQCYGIERWPHQLYVLFDAGVPRNAMQSMSTDILEALTNPKATVSF